MISFNKINFGPYMEQKVNLIPYKTNDVFFIPAFTLSTIAIPNANNEKFYLLFFNIKTVIRHGRTMESKRNSITNIIFQYDLNYSTVNNASGTISISKKVDVKFSKNEILAGQVDNNDENIKYNNNNGINNTWTVDSLSDAFYKILLPAKAVKLDAMNTLNYSFGTNYYESGADYYDDNLRIFRKSNYGSLSFYFSSSYHYQVLVNSQLFANKKENASISNALFLSTVDFYKYDPYNSKSEREKITKVFMKEKNCKIIAKPLLLEHFYYWFMSPINFDIAPLTLIRRVEGCFTNFEQFYFDKFKIIANNFPLPTNFIISVYDQKAKKVIQKVNAKFIENSFPKWKYDATFQEMQLDIPKYYHDGEKQFIKTITYPNYNDFDYLITLPITINTFFNYKFDIIINVKSDLPIISTNSTSLVSITKMDPQLLIATEKWLNSNMFILTADQIAEYYTKNDFIMMDYLQLKGSSNDNSQKS